MIRPVGMGCVSFKSRTIMGGENSKSEPKNEQEKQKRGLTRNEKNIFIYIIYKDIIYERRTQIWTIDQLEFLIQD